MNDSVPLKDEPMTKLVAYLADQLVEHRSEVHVEAFDEDGETVIELEVAEEDLGKVIGRQGKTARAMRLILSAAGSKLKKRYALEILE